MVISLQLKSLSRMTQTNFQSSVIIKQAPGLLPIFVYNIKSSVTTATNIQKKYYREQRYVCHLPDSSTVSHPVRVSWVMAKFQEVQGTVLWMTNIITLTRCSPTPTPHPPPAPTPPPMLGGCDGHPCLYKAIRWLGVYQGRRCMMRVNWGRSFMIMRAVTLKSLCVPWGNYRIFNAFSSAKILTVK